MPRVPRGGCGTVTPVSSAIPWAWVGEKTKVIASTAITSSTTIDFDSASGFGFFTNDTATFSNGATNAGFHGISCLVGGVYVAEAMTSFITNHAIAHGTKRAWLSPVDPITCSLAAFDFGRVLDTNLGYTNAGIDASPQEWQLYDQHLFNVPDGIIPSHIPGYVTFTVAIGQESGFDATSLPALFVWKIADALPGGIS